MQVPEYYALFYKLATHLALGGILCIQGNYQLIYDPYILNPIVHCEQVFSQLLLEFLYERLIIFYNPF